MAVSTRLEKSRADYLSRQRKNDKGALVANILETVRDRTKVISEDAPFTFLLELTTRPLSEADLKEIAPQVVAQLNLILDGSSAGVAHEADVTLQFVHGSSKQLEVTIDGEIANAYRQHIGHAAPARR